MNEKTVDQGEEEKESALANQDTQPATDIRAKDIDSVNDDQVDSLLFRSIGRTVNDLRLIKNPNIVNGAIAMKC
jgi:hypothetical protein